MEIVAEFEAAVKRNRIEHEAKLLLIKGAEARGSQILADHNDDLFTWLNVIREPKAKYWDVENNQVKPAIEKLGYHSVRFYTIDGDDFGPLVRGVEFQDSANFYYLVSYG